MALWCSAALSHLHEEGSPTSCCQFHSISSLSGPAPEWSCACCGPTAVSAVLCRIPAVFPCLSHWALLSGKGRAGAVCSVCSWNWEPVVMLNSVRGTWSKDSSASVQIGQALGCDGADVPVRGGSAPLWCSSIIVLRGLRICCQPRPAWHLFRQLNRQKNASTFGLPSLA